MTYDRVCVTVAYLAILIHNRGWTTQHSELIIQFTYEALKERHETKWRLAHRIVGETNWHKDFRNQNCMLVTEVGKRVAVVTVEMSVSVGERLEIVVSMHVPQAYMCSCPKIVISHDERRICRSPQPV